MTAPIFSFAFNRDRMAGLNIIGLSGLDQFRIPPNVFVTLLLGKINPKQVFRDFPHFTLNR
jgi:hypothetical protein